MIYVYYVSESAFYMLFAYAKGRQADLTRAQVKALRHFVAEALE